MLIYENATESEHVRWAEIYGPLNLFPNKLYEEPVPTF